MGSLLKPKTPDVPKPAPMPDDDQLDAARRRKIAAVQQRSGRISTILSDADTLGPS
jgi:hypothetical protein